ncbi:putative high mobility group protein [carnivorous sponge associated iridovirus]|jgi:hypothetical protein|nr:putative high mobility group protein [carnivorous sponge associated iridovirus]
MVKEENAHYHNVNKFVVAFLNASAFATPELIDEWKTKSNLNKLKSAIKKTDKPSHPPRPKSEYIFFCEEVRPIIQEEMRRELGEDGKECKIDIHDVTCELGRRWKQFKQVPDPEMKKRIAELAETDRKRYHIEKDAMQKKETKNDNHLKSKYLYFCKEERDKNPKIMLSNIAIMWAANKDDDKLNERYQTAKEKAIAAPVSIEA